MKELNRIEISQVNGGLQTAVIFPIVTAGLSVIEGINQIPEVCRQKDLLGYLSCVGFKMIESGMNGAKVGVIGAWANNVYNIYHEK